MNRRIQALKRQARDFYLEDANLDCSVQELHQLVDAKFAELLVQECANLVRGVPTCGPGSKGCDEIIREHFHIR